MEEDTLYAELYGSAAPVEQKPTHQPVQPAQASSVPPKTSSGAAGARQPFVWSRQPEERAVFSTPEAAAGADDSDEELDVKLDESTEQAEEDDELNINLDVSLQTALASEQQLPSLTAAKQDSAPLVPAGVPPPKPPSGAPPAGTPAAPHPGPRPTPGPSTAPLPYGQQQQQQQQAGFQQRRPHLPHLPPALPQQAQPGQPIMLPGQSRVAPEEYREFLILGHGGVFDLDLDNVVDAPWKVPGADPRDFFNYGLNMSAWRQYCQRIRQFRSEFALQKRIQTYEGAPQRTHRSDLPPELAAAVAAEAEAQMAARAANPSIPTRRPATSQADQRAGAASGSTQDGRLPAATQPLRLPAANGSFQPATSTGTSPVSAAPDHPQGLAAPAVSLGSTAPHSIPGTAMHMADHAGDGSLPMPSLPGSSVSTAENGQHSQSAPPMPPSYPTLMEDGGMFGSITEFSADDGTQPRKRPRRDGTSALVAPILLQSLPGSSDALS